MRNSLCLAGRNFHPPCISGIRLVNSFDPANCRVVSFGRWGRWWVHRPHRPLVRMTPVLACGIRKKAGHGDRPFRVMVPTGRLELPRLSPLPPQGSVYTNFTTSAEYYRAEIIPEESWRVPLPSPTGLEILNHFPSPSGRGQRVRVVGPHPHPTRMEMLTYFPSPSGRGQRVRVASPHPHPFSRREKGESRCALVART